MSPKMAFLRLDVKRISAELRLFPFALLNSTQFETLIQILGMFSDEQ
jgi:hypothetical protein